jgi:hypothetical protein
MPVSQSQTIEKPKLTCAYTAIQESKFSKSVQTAIPNTLQYTSNSTPSYTYIPQEIMLPDVFVYLHVKIPARILHQQFLI